jgi:hypothetical protein
VKDDTAQLDGLRDLIAAVRRRWFLAVAFRTLGTGAAIAAIPLACGIVAYRVFAPTGGALLLLAGASTLLAIAAAGLIARRIEPRPDDTRVARFIEERAEALPLARSMDDTVVSAVQAAKVPADDQRVPFAALVIGAAVRRLDGIDAATIVPSSWIRRAALAGAGGMALLLVTLFAGLPALRHSLETARLRLFPQSISVEVVPGDVRIVAGQPLTIRARLTSGGESLSRAVPQLVVTAEAGQRTVEMAQTDGGFQFAFESIDRTFRYKVAAGGVSSSEYTVTALFPPRVKQIDVLYQYPSFTALAPRTDEDAGDVYAPAGTRVTLKIHTDKPIATGRLGLLRGAPELRSTGEQTLEADFVVARDDSYRIELLDRDGLASSDDSEYFIRVMEDRPPEVRILRPSADQSITPLQEVPIEARAEDDYGIASLELVYSVGGGRERAVPLTAIASGETQRTGAYLLAAEELNVSPGDVITYYARARDVARGRRSTETRSDMFFLEVKPFNEEFVAAQSQASGGAGGDPQLEALIQLQKDIINATWNIERRSAGGRSSDDVQAIAKAQADLKARVERLLAGNRSRRGRGFIMERQVTRPQAPPARQGDPIASAVEAMTRAIEQLASEKTSQAIPHEMAALNGLLQAQAEVRRRQVSQQARGGGGGGNRQSQDLSALFDKELQRQQRTNYEQRSQVEERQDQQQGNQDLLDRVKDLARRQEELSRRQRELAQMKAEERKRQLERLAREQQDLQRQAEELSREIQQRGSQGQQSQQQSGQQQSGQRQSGQQQSGQQQSGQSQGMRSALEQMRRASNDMRRDDAASAAQNSERAAEQLRQLEQQMRGGTPDARQRAAADLQSEAQQIAEEQRRIAAEAERMEKSAQSGDPDARRRLAADKDRLSDRVDSLKQAAERLGREKGAGDESARAREAAGTLEKEKVGQRMRESAQQMRDGTKPSGQSEQQLARTLDGVVDKLGGAASAEARKLAEQLDRSREIRGKLDELEAHMRQAEGRKDGELEKLRQQYDRELGRAREMLGQQTEGGRDGARGTTPEEQQFSRSAPGTEAFKQDRSRWESLRKDLDRALEEHDADVSRRLAKTHGEDRLNAGGSDRVPEQYRRLVAKYYESLARKK